MVRAVSDGGRDPKNLPVLPPGWCVDRFAAGAVRLDAPRASAWCVASSIPMQGESERARWDGTGCA